MYDIFYIFKSYHARNIISISSRFTLYIIEYNTKKDKVVYSDRFSNFVALHYLKSLQFKHVMDIFSFKSFDDIFFVS